MCALRAIESESSVEKPSAFLSILIVDDDYNFFEMLNQSIGDELHLDYAPDGFTAFKMVSKKSYDCIVSDINMPFMNGVTLLGEFQKKRLNIPVVLISGNINESVSKQALRAGAYNLLEKPFPIDELMEKIQSAIVLHREEQPNEASDQDKAYIYNSLKTFYYDIDQIISKINK